MRGFVLFLFLFHGIVGGSRCDALTAVTVPTMVKPSVCARGRPGRSAGRDVRLSASSNDSIEGGSTEDLSKMTVAELKERLRKLHLTVGGRKNELIARLNEHYLSHSSIVSGMGVYQEEGHENNTGGDSPDALTIKDEPQSIELQSLTVPALKDRLRELGLSLGGRKSDLIERLNEHYLSHSSIVSGLDVSQEEGQENNTGGDSPDASTIKDETQSMELQSLTVPALKDRLRELGLPLGGRKSDLIERLLNAGMDDGGSGEKSDTSDAQTVQGIDESIPSSILMDEDEKDFALSDILDDILGDIDDDDEPIESNLAHEPSTILPPLDSDGAESSTGESAPVRRARRKKYWKTQEVRELVRANDPRAVEQSEEMIATLEKIAGEEGNAEYLPGPEQYTLLIESYAKRGTGDAIRRAEDVIDGILQSGDDSEGSAIAPTAHMLNALIQAYANVGNPEAAEKATSILDRMLKVKEFGGSLRPTVHSFSIAISAWSKCERRTAAANAENILNRLLEHYDEVLQNEEESRYAEELTPNNIVFNSVIDSWARSGSPEAGEKSLALLEKMEVFSRLDKYDVRPDTISYNTCIKAFSNSNRPDAPFQAESVLSKLETNPRYPKRNGGVLTVRPNRLSYNTVINCWAKSTHPESAMRAEDLLLRMIKAFKSDAFSTITPDSVTFASVLNALAKSKTVRFKAEKCQSILNAMVELHEDDGSYDTKPNIVCFNTVLNACAFSALGSVEEKRSALKVAVGTFNQMRQGKHVSPDAVSYGNMLKCCANLMPPGDKRNAMASRLFLTCCDEGLVGGMCLDEIRRCVPPRAFLPLLADVGYDEPMRRRRKAHSVQLRELPRKWTENVKRGDMASRQRGSFAKPKRKGERRSRRQVEKVKPVIRRPGLLVEYGSSGRDM